MTAGDLTHRYIDDTTVTELISSHMQSVANNLVFQANQCHNEHHGKKTKEILIGQVNRNAPPLFTLGGTEVGAARRCVGIKS